MGSRVVILEEQEVSRLEDERLRRFGETGHLTLSLNQQGQTH
jgi:hypothetical protein